MAAPLPIDPDAVSSETGAVLDGVQGMLGRVPMMVRLMAHSPAETDPYVHFSRAMSNAPLDSTTPALIAVRVAEIDECGYSRLIARGGLRAGARQ